MPSALYTIAYKPTKSVVALCSFEKRELSDAAAADQLLTELVGAGLPVPLSGSAPAIEIAASELGCDLVADPATADFQGLLANPYRYRVNIDPEEANATTTPGDGKEKFLITAAAIGVSSIELIIGSPSSSTAHVVVTLTGAVTFPATARLLFDDRGPMVVQTTLEEKGITVSRVLVFQRVDAEIKAGEEHHVMFFMEGAPVVARTLNALDPSDATEVAPRAVLRRRSPKPETKAPRKLRRPVRRKRPRKAIKARP